MAGRKPVAGAAIDHDDLVLANLRYAVHHVHDASLDRTTRSPRLELQWRRIQPGNQPIALQGLPLGVVELQFPLPAVVIVPADTFVLQVTTKRKLTINKENFVKTAAQMRLVK